ncbi:hypothetical protein GCM10019059_44390 [Camelimonas fluminis]|uniref:Uncharacterized protein n=1 Tax=Camelimonas fluminis TaxID=1576911 RepID=A0ABV7UJP8_9HYPH|nr:hypothetical protein [Camelimonas fluminis]GHE81587.1 hypothetical protein GCM10019059_44390 [Camelimonas fluminis]
MSKARQVVYGYWQGVERPGRRRDRILNEYLPSLLKEAEEIKAQFEQRLKVIAIKEQLALEEVEDIAFLTEGGRYRREREAGLENRGLASLNERLAAEGLPPEVVRRGRGRPRIHSCERARPRRATRAKTQAGVERALLGLNVRSSFKPGTVLAKVADKLDAEVSSVPLVSGVNSTEARRAPMPALVVVPEGEEGKGFFEDTEGADYDRQIYVSLHAVLSDQSEMARNRMRLPYDFTDPDDFDAMPDCVKKEFPAFGFQAVWPMISDDSTVAYLPDEELRKWIRIAFFDDETDERANFLINREMAYYRVISRFADVGRSSLHAAYLKEMQRKEVLWYVQERIAWVETVYTWVKLGRLTEDQAKCFVSYRDYVAMGSLEANVQSAYENIVNGLEWFPGFSRLELQEWAGDDKNPKRLYRSFEGFPEYAYPDRLMNYVKGEWTPYSLPEDVDFTPPTEAEFERFMREYQANLDMDYLMKSWGALAE